MGKRKNKYIPHLAEFFFKPKYNWSITEAAEMYAQRRNPDVDRIFYGDCIHGMQHLPAKSVDLVIADPPFGIDFSGKESLYNRDATLITEDYHEVVDDYQSFSNAWIGQLPRILKATGSAYIISGYTHLKEVLIAIDKAGLVLKNHIIWHYQFGVFAKTKFVSSHYHILFVVKDPKRYFFHRIVHYPQDVWLNIKRTYAPKEKKNGTKLPVELISRCIDFSSKPGDVVLDPFMGNGTTAVAAYANFRHYLGFEKNKRMEPIINYNLEKATLGMMYVPYHDRLDPPEVMAQRDATYRKAYEEYLKRVKVTS